MPSLPRVDRLKAIYTAAKGLNFAWRFSDHLKTPMQNGVSRYIPQIHRITFRFCKKDESSAGMRNFIQQSIVSLGEQNPAVVIYTQPVRNQIPVIRAEYGNGQTIQVNAKNCSAADIERDVHLLLSRTGNPVVKLETRQNSNVPSIQGEWNPTTWLPTKINVSELPAAEFSEPKSCDVSATEFFLTNRSSSSAPS